MDNLFEELATPETVAQATDRIEWLKGEMYNTLWWLFKNEAWVQVDHEPAYFDWQGFYRDYLGLPKEMEKWPLEEEKLQGLSEYSKTHLKKNQIEALSEYKPQFREKVLREARKISSVNTYTGRKQLAAKDIMLAGRKIFPIVEHVIPHQRGYLRFDGKNIQLKNSDGSVVLEVDKSDIGMLREFLEENK